MQGGLGLSPGSGKARKGRFCHGGFVAIDLGRVAQPQFGGCVVVLAAMGHEGQTSV